MKADKSKDFDEWYNEVVEEADLCDKRYPVKGMNIWKPYGWEIEQNIDSIIRFEMRETGHKEVYFPLLVPESLFQKESEHIRGFGSEVFWVTHAGDRELEERLILRPTSETVLYHIFSLWIRSHADLPLKTFQIVNTFRYETKMTKAFIRVREIHFFEAHTCHNDFEEAEAQIREDIEIAGKFFDKLSLPYMISKRPDWDKFAGAEYSLGIDVLMPSKKILQVASIHQYKDNFSRPFEIKYEDEGGEHKYCHQTTYGMSERVLGAIVGMNGDDKGIALPSSIAPIQVVIVPIIFKGKEKIVEKECRAVKQELDGAGIRTHLDMRDKTPGNKFYDWELKGVPLRIEIGPRDVEKGVVTVATRDGLKKEIDRNNLREIEAEMNLFDRRIFERAKRFLKENIHTFHTLEKKDGIIEVPWCGREKCGLRMEEKTEMKSLGTPFPERKCDGKCVVCGEEGKYWLRLAKSY
ncbi:MAG: proline--tRNA ligase [Candidatus Thermoplasmatota archaeon]|nr:proline--tRNA ligase [Candidatus Thermoplasmatota archaeon]